MNPSRHLVALVGVAASAVLLTACGSSGGSGGGSTAAAATGSGTGASSPAGPAPTTSAPSSASATATAAGGVPTKAQLQKIVLQPSDLPSYKAAAADPDTGDDDMDAALAACTGVKGAPKTDKVDTVQSPDFSLGVVTVSSEFSSYKSAGDVAADVAQLKSPKINDCLNSTFKAELAKSADAGSTVDNVTFQLTPGSGGGPSNVAGLAYGVVNITANGQKAALYLGIAFITGKQLDGTLMYFGVGKQPDAATQMAVLATVAKRAANP